MSKKKSKQKKRHIPIAKILLLTIVFAVSAVLMLYPYISNYIFEHQADGIIETVEKTEDTADKQKYAEEIEKAEQYNKVIATGKITLTDPFDAKVLQQDEDEYESLLNMTDAGVMGFIKIPCIDVSLPIYHGTSKEVLEKGVGHLQGTSLPIGGASTNAILTGHTGLSSAKLFTDLTQMENGDVFFLHIMGEKLAYKVDNISVIKPEDIEQLTVTQGKDYCTLITCTPYGINSHRLVVRGERTEYKEAEQQPENFEIKKTQSKWQQEYTKSIIIASFCFILMLLLLMLYREVQKNRRKKRREKKHSTKKTSG